MICQLYTTHSKYINKHLDHSTGKCTLKPFDVRNATNKDIELCCCKTHLNMHESKAKHDGIDVGSVDSYATFLEIWHLNA